MNQRATQVLAAAVRVLAAHGARGLTHRAVDTAAALPQGSTSNLFRTRRDLVAAVVEAILRNDRERLRAAAAGNPTSLGSLASDFVSSTLRDAPEEVRARAALAMDPDADVLRTAREDFLDDGGDDGRGRVPRQTQRLVVAFVDGVLFDAAVNGAPHDPARLTRMIDLALQADAS
ncbi:TetR/AcrR family transcriptional regulator [Microbacterium testaceum]|uniref:TetR/AcrR family transcriptional regulator n=1 Tax=Microbacterium testaceum TaxID=2033 RepID=UPI0037F2DE07